MIRKSKFLRNFPYLSRNFLGSHPYLYKSLWLMPKFRKNIVYPDTAICIDGFPKSANNFLIQCFSSWNKRVCVPSQIHLPMKIITAVKYNVPCIVTIRDPLFSIASILAVDPLLSYRIIIRSE